MDEAGFRGFIEARRWKFAKTMAHIPHEYTVADWVPWGMDEFNDAVAFIMEHGYQQRFYSRVYTYFDVEEYQYWPMNGKEGYPILINRAVRK
jgi:hypothetical protein